MAARRVTGNPKREGGWDPKRMKPQKTKVTSNGNVACDRAWIDEMADAIVELDAPPPGCFWDVKYQFQGYADEVNPEFFDAHRRTSSKRQCVGIAYIRDERGGYIIDLDGDRLQRPCLKAPIYGASVCTSHGGQLDATKEAAQRLLVDASEKAITTLIVLTGPYDDKGEVIEAGDRIKAANSVLDRAGIKGGTTVEVQLPGYKRVMDRMFSEEVGDGPDS